MRGRLALVAMFVCGAVSSSLAQTATPTNSPVPPTATNTPTRTPTSTPTLSRQGMLVDQYACPTETPICEVRPGIKAVSDSYKTVALTTTAGSGTSQVRCVVNESHLAPSGTLATMTGAACPTPGACVTGFWESCDEVYIGVAGGATVSAWLKIPPK